MLIALWEASWELLTWQQIADFPFKICLWDASWELLAKICQGAGVPLNFDAVQAGHPRCNRYAMALVAGERVADFYERDLTRQLNALAKLAEPVMLLVMGVLVGTIVTSIILPIFKMSRAVH